MASPNGDDQGSPGAGERDRPEPQSILLGHIRRLAESPPPHESFELVHSAYHGKVRQFFLRHGYGPEEAADLTQDTFVRVYRRGGDFESTKAFTGWLFQVALNVHRNAQRALQAAKRDRPEESLDRWIEDRGWEPADTEAGWSTDPLDRVLARELRRMAAEALKELPPKMRRCYLLSLQGQWTYREIADFLDIAEGTVKAHVFQARKRVGERIEAYRRGSQNPGPEGDGS
jgi:RNA polymerase sigma-70 factor (ECF subfamily)